MHSHERFVGSGQKGKLNRIYGDNHFFFFGKKGVEVKGIFVVKFNELVSGEVLAARCVKETGSESLGGNEFSCGAEHFKIYFLWSFIIKWYWELNNGFYCEFRMFL